MEDATTSSPAANPKVGDLLAAGAGAGTVLFSVTDAITGVGAAFTGSDSFCLEAGSGDILASVFSTALTSGAGVLVTGLGRLVTILTAISLLTALGLLSRILGRPTTAKRTNTAAPIRRCLARCCSGSSVSNSS